MYIKTKIINVKNSIFEEQLCLLSRLYRRISHRQTERLPCGLVETVGMTSSSLFQLEVFYLNILVQGVLKFISQIFKVIFLFQLFSLQIIVLTMSCFTEVFFQYTQLYRVALYCWTFVQSRRVVYSRSCFAVPKFFKRFVVRLIVPQTYIYIYICIRVDINYR